MSGMRQINNQLPLSIAGHMEMTLRIFLSLFNKQQSALSKYQKKFSNKLFLK
jgi:hypothetical protein